MTAGENLRGFFTSRPPLVIFLICLGGFAVVLMTLAYIVKVNDQLTNPDLTKEWNMFLESFEDLEFCLVGHSENLTEPVTGPPKLSDKLQNVQNKLMPPSTVKPAVSSEEILNTSLTMLIEVQPSTSYGYVEHNISTLTATVTGNQLGLSGDSGQQELNISVSFPLDWNATKCHAHQGCPSIQILTCVNIMAPRSLFPSARQVGSCYSTKNTTGMEEHGRMVTSQRRVGHLTPTCRNVPSLRIKHKMNSLTMLLTLEDRSVINLHLMHTSYFLFVMFITLFCYALIRGKTTKLKTYTHLEQF